MSLRTLVFAKVTAVRSGSVSYPSCSLCYSKIFLDDENDRWVCKKCQRDYTQSDVVHRYRLSLTVCDATSQCDVIVFGTCLEQFFGISANGLTRYLANVGNQAGSTDLDVSQHLSQAVSTTFLGHMFLFGIKVSSSQLPHRDGPDSCDPVKLADITSLRASNTATQLRDSDLVAYQMLPASDVERNSFSTVFDEIEKRLKLYLNGGDSVSHHVNEFLECDSTLESISCLGESRFSLGQSKMSIGSSLAGPESILLSCDEQNSHSLIDNQSANLSNCSALKIEDRQQEGISVASEMATDIHENRTRHLQSQEKGKSSIVSYHNQSATKTCGRTVDCSANVPHCNTTLPSPEQVRSRSQDTDCDELCGVNFSDTFSVDSQSSNMTGVADSQPMDLDETKDVSVETCKLRESKETIVPGLQSSRLVEGVDFDETFDPESSFDNDGKKSQSSPISLQHEYSTQNVALTKCHDVIKNGKDLGNDTGIDHENYAKCSLPTLQISMNESCPSEDDTQDMKSGESDAECHSDMDESLSLLPVSSPVFQQKHPAQVDFVSERLGVTECDIIQCDVNLPQKCCTGDNSRLYAQKPEESDVNLKPNVVLSPSNSSTSGNFSSDLKRFYLPDKSVPFSNLHSVNVTSNFTSVDSSQSPSQEPDSQSIQWSQMPESEDLDAFLNNVDSADNQEKADVYSTTETVHAISSCDGGRKDEEMPESEDLHAFQDGVKTDVLYSNKGHSKGHSNSQGNLSHEVVCKYSEVNGLNESCHEETTAHNIESEVGTVNVDAKNVTTDRMTICECESIVKTKKRDKATTSVCTSYEDVTVHVSDTSPDERKGHSNKSTGVLDVNCDGHKEDMSQSVDNCLKKDKKIVELGVSQTQDEASYSEELFAESQPISNVIDENADKNKLTSHSLPCYPQTHEFTGKCINNKEKCLKLRFCQSQDEAPYSEELFSESQPISNVMGENAEKNKVISHSLPYYSQEHELGEPLTNCVGDRTSFQGHSDCSYAGNGSDDLFSSIGEEDQADSKVDDEKYCQSNVGKYSSSKHPGNAQNEEVSEALAEDKCEKATEARISMDWSDTSFDSVASDDVFGDDEEEDDVFTDEPSQACRTTYLPILRNQTTRRRGVSDSTWSARFLRTISSRIMAANASWDSEMDEVGSSQAIGRSGERWRCDLMNNNGEGAFKTPSTARSNKSVHFAEQLSVTRTIQNIDQSMQDDNPVVEKTPPSQKRSCLKNVPILPISPLVRSQDVDFAAESEDLFSPSPPIHVANFEHSSADTMIQCPLDITQSTPIPVSSSGHNTGNQPAVFLKPVNLRCSKRNSDQLRQSCLKKNAFVTAMCVSEHQSNVEVEELSVGSEMDGSQDLYTQECPSPTLTKPLKQRKLNASPTEDFGLHQQSMGKEVSNCASEDLFGTSCDTSDMAESISGVSTHKNEVTNDDCASEKDRHHKSVIKCKETSRDEFKYPHRTEVSRCESADMFESGSQDLFSDVSWVQDPSNICKKLF